MLAHERRQVRRSTSRPNARSSTECGVVERTVHRGRRPSARHRCGPVDGSHGGDRSTTARSAMASRSAPSNACSTRSKPMTAPRSIKRSLGRGHRDAGDRGRVVRLQVERLVHDDAAAPVAHGARHRDLDDPGLGAVEAVKRGRGAMRGDADRIRLPGSRHHRLVPRRRCARDPEHATSPNRSNSPVRTRRCKHAVGHTALVRLRPCRRARIASPRASTVPASLPLRAMGKRRER